MPNLHVPPPDAAPPRASGSVLAGILPGGEESLLPVLLVDDDAGFREFIRAALGMHGYHVEVAEGPAEARLLLARNSYGMVLCDYEMPGGNGLELLSFVNEVQPDLPFIILTGYDETVLARDAMQAGAVDFIAKPFKVAHLARALEQNRVRAARERERTTRLSRAALHGTIRALVAAVDAKDPYTACHSARVSEFAVQLGTALDFSGERLQLLEFAALLHDVGKIAVPDSILRKTEPLTDEEWAVLREHPVRSAQIVGQTEALAEVATIVRHHHERIDGAGYPDGLAGEAIPMLSRLITIVDAYEAMTSDRAHRRARSDAEARGVIRENLGTQFDRELGLAFLQLALR